MKMLYFKLVLLMGVMVGCSTVRQAREAQQEEGNRLPAGERTATVAEFGLKEGAQLALETAEEFALLWHPSVALATQQVIAAKIAISKAGAGLRPSLSGSVGYDGNRRSNNEIDWNFTTTEDFNAGLSLSWVLYDFGRTRAGVRNAVAQWQAALESWNGTRVTRVHEVRSAYFKLAQAEAQCRVEEENLRQYEELLRQAETRFKVGTGRKYDVTKARADRSNALLSLLTASNAIVNARAELNNQLGLGKTVTYRLAPEVHLPDPAEDFDALLAVAQTNQPALRMRRAHVDAAMAAVDRSIAELYPEIRASLSSSYASGDLQTLGLSWGISLLQDLFRGYERRDNILVSVTALREARASLALEEQGVVKSLIAALAALKTAREGKVVAEEMEQQAKENVELAKKYFDVGTTSILELTDAQVLYTRARSATVSAYYTLELAKAGVYALIGMQP